MVPPFLSKCIVFLENNNDCVSSRGRKNLLKTTKDNNQEKSGYFLKLGDSGRISEKSHDGLIHFTYFIIKVALLQNIPPKMCYLHK